MSSHFLVDLSEHPHLSLNLMEDDVLTWAGNQTEPTATDGEKSWLAQLADWVTRTLTQMHMSHVSWRVYSKCGKDTLRCNCLEKRHLETPNVGSYLEVMGMNCNILVGSESHTVMSDSLRPRGLYSPWNSPGQNTGMGSCSLLQGIFPTQGWNPGLPHCGQILY